MRRLLKQQYWHDFFEIGVATKAFNSLLELLGGSFLLLTLHGWFTRTFIFISSSELLGDSDDVLFHFATSELHNLAEANTRTFVGIYLLFHGSMNAFLAYNLFRNRLWAYPLSVVFVALFFVYQMYRLYHTHSPVLAAVSVLDVIFAILTIHEYRYQLKKRDAAGA